MRGTCRSISLLAAVVVILVASACGRHTVPPASVPLREDTAFVIEAPGRNYPQVEEVRLARVTKIFCPGGTGDSVARRIGPAGGVLTVRGHSLEIPAGAVQSETEFRLVDERHPRHLVVRAEGNNGQAFGQPVALTINFERCNAAATGMPTLRILRDRRSGPADDVGGEVVQGRRAIRASLTHLSPFLVAN